ERLPAGHLPVVDPGAGALEDAVSAGQLDQPLLRALLQLLGLGLDLLRLAEVPDGVGPRLVGPGHELASRLGKVDLRGGRLGLRRDPGLDVVLPEIAGDLDDPLLDLGVGLDVEVEQLPVLRAEDREASPGVSVYGQVMLELEDHVVAEPLPPDLPVDPEARRLDLEHAGLTDVPAPEDLPVDAPDEERVLRMRAKRLAPDLSAGPLGVKLGSDGLEVHPPEHRRRGRLGLGLADLLPVHVERRPEGVEAKEGRDVAPPD